MNAPLYFIVADTQAGRSKFISALRKKGYQLLETNQSLSYIDSNYPASKFPFLALSPNKHFLDFYQLPPQSQANRPAIQITSADMLGMPKAPKAPKSPKTSVTAPNKADQAGLDLPEPAKFTITYQREDGKVNKYTISNPIAANNATITCYAYGKGIRSFQKRRIQSIQKAL